MSRAVLHEVPLRLATFNAGLAVGLLPHTTERLPYVLSALGALDVDVLFVQEFWVDVHFEALRRAVAARWPHVFRAEPFHPVQAGSCTGAEVGPLVRCAERHCAGLSDEALARCVVENCAATALGLSAPCVNCIASHPSGTLHEIVGRCVGVAPSEAQPTPASPAGYGGLVAYGGSFGTGLLSRVALRDRATLVFDATINARGALHARISVGPISASGDLDVIATHLSPGGAEQEPQVVRLLAWIDEVAGARPAVLLGDLNVTPGSRLYRQLLDAGFREPDRNDARATYGHGLETGRGTHAGWKLDHVLVRNVGARVVSERILDTPLSIATKAGRVDTTLSDHFGVLATLDESSG
jgi:endonuclease/exonuclease/phosphatase family metal-dependent hydrolase